MNFETVDIARSSHVFAVLDEGCNSTCHSKAWAVDAEARLARLGYSMPLKDDSCKSFAGLGSGNTKTEGVRSIPFSLLLSDGNMNGELDSYQLSTGNSPLLLSLHAQTKLGLVKDLAKGVVSIKDQPLNIKRCSKSGLLVLNLTEGLTDIINTPPNELPQIPKCHRKYNLAYTASTSDSAMADHDQTGFHSRDYDILQTQLNDEQRSDRKVIIVTRGRRFQQHPIRSSRSTLSINCEDIYDPDQDVSLRAHVGWHHRILETLSKVDKYNEHLNSILEFVTQHRDDKILVDLECKSGRHRSVGVGFAAFRCLKALGYDVVLIHSSLGSGVRCVVEEFATTAGTSGLVWDRSGIWSRGLRLWRWGPVAVWLPVVMLQLTLQSNILQQISLKRSDDLYKVLHLTLGAWHLTLDIFALNRGR